MKLSRFPELRTETWESGKTRKTEMTGKSAREERAVKRDNSGCLQRDHIKIAAEYRSANLGEETPVTWEKI